MDLNYFKLSAAITLLPEILTKIMRKLLYLTTFKYILPSDFKLSDAVKEFCSSSRSLNTLQKQFLL